MKIGAYAVERDYSHYVAYASKTVLAVVGTASKGPVGVATLVTSTTDLVNKFGPLKTDCLALYAAQYFLSQASKLYFVRAASDSASPAIVKIVGADANDTEILEAITIEMIDKGTYFNNSKLTVSAGTVEGTYDLVVKSNSDATLETIEGIKLEDLTVGYTTKYFKVTASNETIATIDSGDYVFSGGDDGISDINSADYINALDPLFAEQIDCNIISVPGVSDAAVITAGVTLAESRGDSIFLVDPPKGLTRDGAIQWVDGGGSYDHTKFNTSYGVCYFDWVTIYDSVNKVRVDIPPSVVVGATYAYNDRVSELWYAPAGLNRGLVRGVLGPVTSLSRSDIETLYDHNINSIYDDPQVGMVLWGQKTLYRETTALDRVNVRRLMNYLKKVIVAATKYLVFDPNDRVTWNSFEMKVLPLLENIKLRRGLYEYKVVKGESIITSDDIDNYRMPCMILIRPTKAAEEIPIYFSITSTGADFNEVLEANGVVN